MEQAREREHWSAADWDRWQSQELVAMLRDAAANVPHYRHQWQKRRQNGDMRSVDYLENWPVLSKAALRASPETFLRDSADPSRMFAEHTSGTSGKPLHLWWSRETVVAWYALSEVRWREWYGVSRHHRWAILGGQLVTPVKQRRPPFWVWNAPMKQLYMSAYHLAPDLLPSYVEALQGYKIEFVLGYTSAMYSLARGILECGLPPLKLQVTIANAEPVYPYQREAIEAAFGCPLKETYGMAEIVAAAGQCEHGRMHQWPEVGFAEYLDADGNPVPAGEVGDLVCTGLLNRQMPLIRYRIGDRARVLAERHEGCTCGRRLPLFGAVEGRVDDVLVTVDGREVGRLDPVFKSDLPVLEAQVIQETLRRIRVLIVPGPNFNEQSEAAIRQRVRERMGPIDVDIESVGAIPREKNGKFRAVVNRIPPEQTQRAASVAQAR
jgi:phenylacetate-CoA ligase